MRIIPETDNRQDWPRLVAQTVNELVRRSNAQTGSGSLRFDGGSSAVNGFFVMDGGSA